MIVVVAHSLSLLAVPWRNPKLCCMFPHTNSNTQIPQFPSNNRRRTQKDNVICRSNSSDPKESVYLDENGVVEDMDVYLNYLSLEYDSVWDTKPSWCQPWTITLTGVLIVSLSWVVLHSVLVSTLALSLVGAWWYIFLYSYPKGYADMIAMRRKKINDGLEDTYGSRKGQ